MEKKYRPIIKNQGPRLRSLLNSVKHTAQSFARLHNLDPDHLEAVMASKQPLSEDIISAIEAHPPLSTQLLFGPAYKDRFPIRDDTVDGVVILTARERLITERIFERGPKGGQIPYYAYADTAMSRTSPFRPEWIKELYVHNGENPDLPDWAFNNGHLEYQLTYFIGPVNFHWKDNAGHKHVRRMNTGDTNYITPFVPHSFTTREEGQGLILAVTYGGAIAAHEFQSRIQTMSLDEYLFMIAEKLELPDDILLIDELRGIVVRHHKQATRNDMTTTLVEGIPNQPYTKAFEYSVKAGKCLNFKVDSQRWGYNVGQAAVKLAWGSYEVELGKGDSFFIQANVPHALMKTGVGHGLVVVMEIMPSVGDPFKDLALIRKYAGEGGLRRVHSETMQWF